MRGGGAQLDYPQARRGVAADVRASLGRSRSHSSFASAPNPTRERASFLSLLEGLCVNFAVHLTGGAAGVLQHGGGQERAWGGVKLSARECRFWIDCRSSGCFRLRNGRKFYLRKYTMRNRRNRFKKAGDMVDMILYRFECRLQIGDFCKNS